MIPTLSLKEIIDCEGYEEVSNFTIKCYQSTLLKNIGHYKKGCIIPIIEIDFFDGTIDIYNNNNEIENRYEFLIKIK